MFHKKDESTEIIALFEWDSLENAHEFAAADDLRETKKAAGVVGEPDLHFLINIADVPD